MPKATIFIQGGEESPAPPNPVKEPKIESFT